MNLGCCGTRPAASGRGLTVARQFAILVTVGVTAGAWAQEPAPGKDRPAETSPFSQELDFRVRSLETLIRFVEWPEESRPRNGSPFVVAVAGPPELVEAVRNRFRGVQVARTEVLVRQLDRTEHLRDCHLVYFCRRTRFGHVSKLVTGPVLTVGESPGFLAAGGMVNFMPKGRSLFQVNERALREAGLMMSSKLLRLAEVFREPEPAPAPLKPSPSRER